VKLLPVISQLAVKNPDLAVRSRTQQPLGDDFEMSRLLGGGGSMTCVFDSLVEFENICIIILQQKRFLRMVKPKRLIMQ
jgi:hypothetical protein